MDALKDIKQHPAFRFCKDKDTIRKMIEVHNYIVNIEDLIVRYGLSQRTITLAKSTHYAECYEANMRQKGTKDFDYTCSCICTRVAMNRFQALTLLNEVQSVVLQEDETSSTNSNVLANTPPLPTPTTTLPPLLSKEVEACGSSHHSGVSVHTVNTLAIKMDVVEKLLAHPAYKPLENAEVVRKLLIVNDCVERLKALKFTKRTIDEDGYNHYAECRKGQVIRDRIQNAFVPCCCKCVSVVALEHNAKAALDELKDLQSSSAHLIQ